MLPVVSGLTVTPFCDLTFSALVQLLEAAIRAADMASVQELLPGLAASPLLGFGVLQAACCGCAGSSWALLVCSLQTRSSCPFKRI